jgi:Fur family zinc uptake transcriptional regulator
MPRLSTHLPPSTGRDIQALLSDAETLCRQRGVRWTALRRRVLEIILNHPGPVGAYDILAVLQREQGRTAAPPTVYRALDFLLEQNLVHRLTSLSAYLVCSHPQEHHRAQFMICTQCGSVLELADPAIIASVERTATDRGFQVEEQVVEITGCCQQCQQRGVDSARRT